ncbi:MAG: hypothetical protein K2X91_13125, partial [Thermoleophilia bacterium]|nr:hypothetical protein [Thermoleophilia bacterium]
RPRANDPPPAGGAGVIPLAIQLAAANELDPNIAVPAVLTLVGVAITALFAFLASRARKNPPAIVDEPKVAPSPLANFSGTQNEFMALVIADNAAIRSELGDVKREVESLRTELQEARSIHGAFERAVRRYLELLAGVWPGPDPMPWPDSDDIAVLERTLPRWGRGRNGQRKPPAAP